MFHFFTRNIFHLILRLRFVRSKARQWCCSYHLFCERRRHTSPVLSSLPHEPTSCICVTPNNDKSSAVGNTSLSLSCGHVVVIPPYYYYERQIRTFSSTTLSERRHKCVYSSNIAKGQIIVQSIYFKKYPMVWTLIRGRWRSAPIHNLWDWHWMCTIHFLCIWM